MNVFVLVDKFIVREFFFGIGGYISFGLKLFALIILLLIRLVHYFKRKSIKEETENGKTI